MTKCKITKLMFSFLVLFAPLMIIAQGPPENIGAPITIQERGQYQERIEGALESVNERVKEQVQERVQERIEEAEEKRNRFQEIIIEQFPDKVVQDRFTQFQERIEDMNARVSERYFNHLENATTATKNIIERFSEEEMSTTTKETLEDFYSHIEEMEEKVVNQLSNEYYIEEADSVREVVQGFTGKIQELLSDHKNLQKNVIRETQELRIKLMRKLAADFSNNTEDEN